MSAEGAAQILRPLQSAAPSVLVPYINLFPASRPGLLPAGPYGPLYPLNVNSRVPSAGLGPTGLS